LGRSNTISDFCNIRFLAEKLSAKRIESTISEMLIVEVQLLFTDFGFMISGCDASGSSTVYYLLGDHLGSTSLTANSSGSKVAELRSPVL